MSGRKNNPQNDRVKRKYFVWLKEAKQRVATVKLACHAIDRLEVYTGFKNFGSFNREQALGLKRALLSSKAVRLGKAVSIATVHMEIQRRDQSLFAPMLLLSAGRRRDRLNYANTPLSCRIQQIGDRYRDAD